MLLKNYGHEDAVNTVKLLMIIFNLIIDSDTPQKVRLKKYIQSLAVQIRYRNYNIRSH